jgi:type IV pilus assembly protein PilB
MGLEPYLVSSTLNGVISQRLLRKLCPKCKQAYTPSKEELSTPGFIEAGLSDTTKVVFYQPVGCQSCSNTGFKGRFSVGEALVFSENIEKMVADEVGTHELYKQAIDEGMISLRVNGLRKVLEGETTLKEVFRAAG